MGIDYPILQHGVGALGSIGMAGEVLSQSNSQGLGSVAPQSQVIIQNNWAHQQRLAPTTKLEKIFYDVETERLNNFRGVNSIGQIITYTGKPPQYGP